MTSREREVLELIRKKPMISQKELADILGITRSSAAVHITNLIKKGHIMGKGYIVKDEGYICVIGGANIDIQGFPKDNLIMRDSNPGTVKISLGGVGRNISENIVKLGVNTKFISVLGGDVYGNKILDDAQLIGLDMQHSLVLKDQLTSTYLATLDESRDMMVAIASMDIFDKMSIDFIVEKKHVIENAALCVIDTNIPKEIIEYIVTNVKNTIFFLDTVSTSKARKVKDIIRYFHTIKPNRIEAEMLSGIKINSDNDLRKASEYFLTKGVKRVFITMGKDGVYYNDGINERHLQNPKIKVVNSTGAGDAFVAGLAYSYINDFDIDYSTRFAMTASMLALSYEDTINPNMSVENINRKMEELGLC